MNERYGSSFWFLSCYRLCRSTWEVDEVAELPRSLPEFEARFPDEAACARWLLERRWPGGFRCPACGHDKGWELARERLTLQCAACERQVSVTAGTVLHGSPLPLRTWFLAAWLMAPQRQRHLGPAAVEAARARLLQVGLAPGPRAAPGDGRSRARAARLPGRGGRDQPALSRQGRAGPAR